MTVIAAPKGTRDFYPADMALREHIFASWRRTCSRFGFEEFDAPMFEHLELYTQKSGAEIEKQLYAFTDKGERQISLRPEMTPSLARMVAAKGTSLPKPIRWCSVPRLFRYERMQRGRLREFFQLNLDILGIEEVSADAEIIAASVAMMTDLGFDSSDFGVHISSRTLLEQYLLNAGVAAGQLAALYALLDRRHKTEADEYQRELAALVTDSAVREKVDRILSAKSLDDLAALGPELPSLTQLRSLFEFLGAYGLDGYVLFDIGIVRGLAYYTGIVFELLDRRRTLRAIAGGGRYDNLVAQCGGPQTPAVGFAAGDVVLGEMLKDKGLLPGQPPRSSVFVVCFEEQYPAAAIAVCSELRAAGISAEYSLKKQNIGRQFKQADTARAPLALIIGSDGDGTEQIKIKRLASGEECVTSRDTMVATIKKMM